MSEHGFCIGLNKLVNSTTSRTEPKVAPKRASKKAFKTVPKNASNKTSKMLPYEECALSKQHQDEMIAVSVLLIGTSLVFFFLFK